MVDHLRQLFVGIFHVMTRLIVQWNRGRKNAFRGVVAHVAHASLRAGEAASVPPLHRKDETNPGGESRG